MTTKIKLGEKVMVSDPCYSIPTWCQSIIDNVKPGHYLPFVKKSDEGDWGLRNSMLLAIHEDHQSDEFLHWKEHHGTVGVDSGQAGIFSMESYRNDDLKLEDGDYGPFPMNNAEDGDKWYEKMCTRTLGDKQWGTYDEGVVCSSGYGDGNYQLFLAYDDDTDTVIGFLIDFGVEEGTHIDFEFHKDVANNFE